MGTELRPSALRSHYSDFLHGERILLTGHSHQAWPNVAKEGLLESYRDAALHADDKWARAGEKGNAIRSHIATAIGAKPEEIALGQSTHELVTRFLSALPLLKKRRIVTTDGEFHSMRRQLSRLAEEGVELVVVAANPVESLAERLAESIDANTAALMVSSVLFETSTRVFGLGYACARAAELGVEVLIDAYHGFGVFPFELADFGPHVFLTAGGYKYAQWGEGTCFLRVPPTDLRPVYTGWFAEFGTLDQKSKGAVGYSADGASRFAGSTYDPASHYRAAAVIEFFASQGMSAHTLAPLYGRQTEFLIDGLRSTGRVLTPEPAEARGGFVALRQPNAAEVVSRLRARNLFVDSRGDVLRIGPAPYVLDSELDRCLELLRQ